MKHEGLLKLTPCFKDYIWGGVRLRDEFGKGVGMDRVAESWELSCHEDGLSVINGGSLDGMTLHRFLELEPEAAGCTELPILVKLIDARDRLSVQVHPDTQYTEKFGGEPKTEMWYVIDSLPDASLIYGLSKELSKEQFAQMISDNTISDALKAVPVKAGDVFFIPSGTIHAIGAGILIAEIQQSSNTTFRVSDYGRLGADGKPRQLHIKEAIEASKLCPAPEQPHYSDGTLASCEFFNVSEHYIDGSENFEASHAFTHLLVLSGEGCVTDGTTTLELKKGDSIFVCANNGFSLSGKLHIIKSGLPEA